MFGKGALFRLKCEEAAGLSIRQEVSGHSESKGKYESVDLIETLMLPVNRDADIVIFLLESAQSEILWNC